MAKTMLLPIPMVISLSSKSIVPVLTPSVIAKPATTSTDTTQNFHQVSTMMDCGEATIMRPDHHSQSQRKEEGEASASCSNMPCDVVTTQQQRQQQKERQNTALVAAVDELQEQISYENEIGMDLLRMNKAKTALFHFSKGLQIIQQLSHVKKELDLGCDQQAEMSNNGHCCESPVVGALSMRIAGGTGGSIRNCRPLSMDTLHSASSTQKWEVFGSLALMHNCALAHSHDKHFREAKDMLTLAVKLLKNELSSAADLHEQLKQSNRYAAMVVTSLYSLLGQALQELKLVTESKKAIMAATGLHKRYLSVGSASSRTFNMKTKPPSNPEPLLCNASVRARSILQGLSTRREHLLPVASSPPQSPKSTTEMSVTAAAADERHIAAARTASNKAAAMETGMQHLTSRSFSSGVSVSSSLSDSR